MKTSKKLMHVLCTALAAFVLSRKEKEARV